MLEDLVVATAAIAHMAGDDANAARLLAWVRSQTFAVGRILPTPSGYALYQNYVRRVRAAVSGDEAHRYIEEGRTMSENDAVACARFVLASDLTPPGELDEAIHSSSE